MLNANKFRTIYDDFLASGLTVRDFCSNQNMHEAKFYYWQNKLKGILPPKKGFVPVVFENSQPLGETTGVERLQHSSGDGSAIPCEITYPNGVCLKLEKMPGLDVLQSLLLLNPGQHV
ncbi:hypothetical protein SAMN05444274_11320 [Mariniphaga anaerophila]|uniref:Transposase n=1 Tax=Mariniphaga anaerophila TaxID=1484053 RepID=A0A1M5FKG7_9BACT|nr:hypothetical protein [Mariniphaga anaerophila]SHF91996.1 hypothetical protein SAMN05444274_11320 [Mariniphaga anaerophila]